MDRLDFREFSSLCSNFNKKFGLASSTAGYFVKRLELSFNKFNHWLWFSSFKYLLLHTIIKIFLWLNIKKCQIIQRLKKLTPRTMQIRISVIFSFILSSVCCDSNIRIDENVCGIARRSTGFMVQNSDLRRGEFPWIVALLYTKGDKPLFFCGGTLVTKNHVITGDTE